MSMDFLDEKKTENFNKIFFLPKSKQQFMKQLKTM